MKLSLAAIALMAVAPCAQALSHHFTFTQAGYELGAHVEGSLYLQDFNNDGMISDDGPLGDSLGGHMQLIGHPAFPNLLVTLYGGSFDLKTWAFNVHGDSPAPWNPSLLIDGFLTNFGGGFSDLPAPTYSLSSSAPVILQRVPDELPGATALLATLVLAGWFHSRRRDHHGMTSVSMVI
jgi:hypothetical protein